MHKHLLRNSRFTIAAGYFRQEPSHQNGCKQGKLSRQLLFQIAQALTQLLLSLFHLAR